MKSALNGSLIVGSLDGANTEILEEVGEGNIYMFGPGVETRRAASPEEAGRLLEKTPALRRVLDAVHGGLFSAGQPGLFNPLCRRLLEGDPYFHLADFGAYLEAHIKAGTDYSEQKLWAGKAVLNIARTGRFSSDRSALEYGKKICGVP
jgi:starch phosphorylase